MSAAYLDLLVLISASVELLIRKGNRARTPYWQRPQLSFRERIPRQLLGLPLLRAIEQTKNPIDKLPRPDSLSSTSA